MFAVSIFFVFSLFLIQSKGKVASVRNWAPRHEGVLGSGGIAPRILHLGTRWRLMMSFTPRPIYRQWKSSWYPLHRWLGGPQRRSGRCGKEKNLKPLPGLEPPIIQPVMCFLSVFYSLSLCIYYLFKNIFNLLYFYIIEEILM